MANSLPCQVKRPECMGAWSQQEAMDVQGYVLHTTIMPAAMSTKKSACSLDKETSWEGEGLCNGVVLPAI